MVWIAYSAALTRSSRIKIFAVVRKGETMDDLISRQAAIELIESEYRRWGEEYGITDVLCDLDALPTAEPNDEEAYEAGYTKAQMELKDAYKPKKGKWEVTGRKNIYGGIEIICDMCGKTLMTTNVSDEHYCRNCGARMEE